MADMAAIFVTPLVFLLALVQLVLRKNLVVPQYRPWILILATRKRANLESEEKLFRSEEKETAFSMGIKSFNLTPEARQRHRNGKERASEKKI
jgi:hypothetical protein